MQRFKTLLLVAGLVALAQPCMAVPTLYLSDGVNSVTVSDGSGLDANSTAGAVTFIGALGIGPWVVNVTTGITKPVLGSAIDPFMDLNSVDVSTTAGTLTIRWSDDFWGPTPEPEVEALIGGTISAGGSLVYKTYGNPLNAVCTIGPCPGLLTSGAFGSGAFSGGAFASTFGLGSAFSLTQEVMITHTLAGVTSFNASLNAVPEPGTLLLLGSGLTGLALRRRRKA